MRSYKWKPAYEKLVSNLVPNPRSRWTVVDGKKSDKLKLFSGREYQTSSPWFANALSSFLLLTSLSRSRSDPEVRNIGRGQIKLRMLGVHPHVIVLFDFSSFEMVETNRNPKHNGSFQSRSFLQARAVRNGVAQLCVCVFLYDCAVWSDHSWYETSFRAMVLK